RVAAGQPRPLQFALLESPPQPQQLAAAWQPAGPFKVAVTGRAGVGKSALISALTGRSPSPSWRETPGLAVHRQFWPCRLRRAATAATAPEEPPLLCHLQFWEAGDAASRSFEHLRNELRLACDCVLFVFSVADRASVAELPAVVRRTLDGGSEGARRAACWWRPGWTSPRLSRAELLQLERDCRLPLVRFSPDMPSESAWQLLTRLCECLWHRR
uniref:REM2- and Rab-like small GTPase 1 n=1 Tax=Macrostomum lignano TaxID=282301 RepID=A0A1I8ITD2_9PLAT